MNSLYFDLLAPTQRREFELDVRRRQRGVCFVCELPVSVDAVSSRAAELEHISPLESGGSDTPANIALIHASCASGRAISDLRTVRDLARMGGGLEAHAESTQATPPPVVVGPPVVAARPSTAQLATAQPIDRSTPVRPPAGPTTEDRAAGDSDGLTYGGALGFTVLGALVPGAAYFAAGRRRLGLITLGVVALLVLVLAGAVYYQDGPTRATAHLVSRPGLFDVLGVGVLVAAALWAIVIATGHRMLIPEGTSGGRQALGAALTLVLAVAVVGPSLVASRYAFATHDLIKQVFNTPMARSPGGAPIDAADPWKNTPRLNILLLGGDPADGGLTTNTMIVASIDTATGDTLLFGLPRNLQNVPIPADNPLHATYPMGYSCGPGPTSCLLSGLYNEARVTHADLFGNDPNPGLTTLRGSIGEITGLTINYDVLVDLDGFRQVVDSLGGIRMNVGPEPVPIVDLDTHGNPLPPDPSTAYIPPGSQHLDGEAALAFARERTATFTNDDRMLRQRAVVTAIVDQANPVTVLIHYLALASAAGDAISTDVPAALFPALFDLSKLVQSHEIRSLPINQDDIASANPDFDYIRRLIQTSVAAGT